MNSRMKKKLHNVEVNNLYSPPDNIRVNKSS
jgi:hypothetical protein